MMFYRFGFILLQLLSLVLTVKTQYNDQFFEATSLENADDPSPKKFPWKHYLKYKGGDHRYHFGHHRSHWSSSHRYRNIRQPDYPPRRNPLQPWVPSASNVTGKALKTRSSDNSLSKYVVQVFFDETKRCNGVLISNKEVLAPSTCLIQHLKTVNVKTKDGTTIEAQVTGPVNEGLVSDIKGILTHLELVESLPSNFIPPSLCTESSSQDVDVFALEWNNDDSKIIYKHTKTLDKSKCKSIYEDKAGSMVTEFSFCVVNKNEAADCNKNIGMPLFNKGLLCGVNLGGHNCPIANGADVYATVINTKELEKHQAQAFMRTGAQKFIT